MCRGSRVSRAARSPGSRLILGCNSTMSTNWSAWRRSSSASTGDCVEMGETTLTPPPRRCTASTSERKSPSPEQHHVVDVAGEFHGVYGELDIHVAFDLAAAGLVDELFGRF